MGNIPVRINKFYMDADLKIAVGSILPHPFAGFSGGAKLVIPGLASIEILVRIHKLVLKGLGGGAGRIDNNKFRNDIEKAVSEIGLDYFVGYIPNAKRQIVGVFAGDMISAHRAGAAYAKAMYETEVINAMDIAILNAYPKDTEFLQSDTVFSILKPFINKINERGTVVVTTACSEGFGYHSLFSPGMELYRRPSEKGFLSERRLIYFSPNINKYESCGIVWEGYSFFNKWEDVVLSLSEIYTDSCRVAIFPTAPIQLAKN